jgi:hypothetical protein
MIKRRSLANECQLFKVVEYSRKKRGPTEAGKQHDGDAECARRPK